MSSNFKRLNDSVQDFYPLHMTSDRKTEMYVKFAKIMLIFQGSVTEERRLAVNELQSKFKYACRVISDKTYTQETSHLFSVENTDDFYSYFRNRVKKSCAEGYNLIIIDQSMTNSIQTEYYFYLAQTMQYLIVPYPPLVRTDRHNYGSRQNQASEFTLSTKRRVAQGNLFNHLFCGWFLHDVDSVELREDANLYVQDCFGNLPEFKEIFSKLCKPSEFQSFYNMEDKRQNLAFCTVKIFQNLLDIQACMSSEAFMKFYGKMSKLYIVGFIISPHMIAARIRLTFQQKNLWDMRDSMDESYQIALFPSLLLKSTKVNPPTDEVTLIASKCNRTIISGETISEPTKVSHSLAKGSSCHILLGKVDNAPVRNVDYDVAFAVHRERKVVQKYSDDVKPYELDRCFVRRIGKYWYIYLKESIIVNGLFATCCSVQDNQA